MSPLTKFIIAMLPLDAATAARANATKLAAKYGISPAHAAGFLALHAGVSHRRMK